MEKFYEKLIHIVSSLRLECDLQYSYEQTLIDSVKNVLNQEEIKSLFHCPSNKCEKTCQLLHNLIELLVEFKLKYPDKENECLACLDTITRFNIQPVLKISTNIFLRLLSMITIFSNTSDLILDILLRMSEHKFYGNISIEINELELIYIRLDELINSHSLNTNKLKLIKENIKGDSIEERLCHLEIKFLENVKETNVTFLKDLRFISILLNNGKCFQWTLFSRFDSFRVFVNILKNYVLVLRRNHFDDEETVYRSLRDLLEIIYKGKIIEHLRKNN